MAVGIKKTSHATQREDYALTTIERGHASLDHVVAESATAEIIGVSKATLRRMVERGEGPRRIKLSARRIGYRMSDLEAWLRSREMVAGS